MKIRIARNVYEQLKVVLKFYNIESSVEYFNGKYLISFHVHGEFGEDSYCYDSKDVASYIIKIEEHADAMRKTLEIFGKIDDYVMNIGDLYWVDTEVSCDAEEIGEKMNLYIEDGRFDSLLDLLKTWQPEAEIIDELNDDITWFINRQLALFHKGMITHHEMMTAITEIFEK